VEGDVSAAGGDRAASQPGRFARIAVGLFVAGLLVATATAFVIAQNVKSAKSPIYATRVSKLFSPVCRCRSRLAVISFRLRHADRLTLTILDAHGRSVRTLDHDHATPGGLVRFRWDGKLNDGRLAPDGVYRVAADLTDADRSIELVANPIRIDTQPPRIRFTGERLRPRALIVRYRLSKPAHALLYIGRTRVVYTRRQPRTGAITIILNVLKRRHLTGLLQLAAEDAAGNHSPPVPIGITVTTSGWKHT